MSNISRWDTKLVLDQVREQLTENMEIAAKAVETDARRRLLAIKEPDWGAGYRKLLALYRLTSVVKSEAKSVTGIVGLPKDPKGSYSGWWIEMGSKSAPAHPWLRPALEHNKKQILALLAGK